MKILFSLLLVLFGSVSALGAQQKFSSLPIGANLDEYISSIQLYIGTDGNYQEESFRYNRQYDGSLETFAAAKLREVTSRFVPKAGQASALHGWGIDAIYSGTQKCLSASPGISPVSFSDLAVKKIRARKSLVVGYIGRMVPEKGGDLLVRAFKVSV